MTGVELRALLRGLLLVFVLLTLLAPARSFAASPRPRRIVVLAHGGDSPELTQRVRAELSATGFVVTELVRAVPPTASELLSIAAEAHALAALLSSPRGVEIWVMEPESVKFAYHEQIRGADGDTADAPGLRAVEVLRAQLSLLKLSADAQALPVANAPRATAPEAWSTETWIGGGFGVSHSVGGVGLLPHAGMSLLVEPWPLLRVGALGVATVLPSKVLVSAGKIDVNVSLAALWCEVPFSQSNFGAALGGGAGIVLLTLDGKASNSGYQGQGKQLVSGAWFGHFALFGRLSPAWRLRSNVRFGVTAPRSAIQSVKETVATWGRPFLLTTLEIEARLP